MWGTLGAIGSMEKDDHDRRTNTKSARSKFGMKDAEDNDKYDQQLKRQTDRGARKTAAKRRSTGRGGRRGARRHHGAHGHVPELAGGPDLSRARRGQLLASRLRDDILLGCLAKGARDAGDFCENVTVRRLYVGPEADAASSSGRLRQMRLPLMCLETRSEERLKAHATHVP